MRIAFKDLELGTGVDVWIANMLKALRGQGVECSSTLYPARYQFAPSLLKLRGRFTDDEDILHSNIAYGYAFRGESPLVVTEHLVVHDPSYVKYKTFAQKMYHKSVYRGEVKSLKAASAVTCVSHYTRTMLKQSFGHSDAHVIYNGLDTEYFCPGFVSKDIYEINPEKFVLLFTGNLTRRKGADLLPGIMKALGDDYVLLTTSGLRKSTKHTYGNIRSVGTVSREELVRLYNVCDALLFPSRLEGFGLSVVEAMACGKPVVATDCSSLPELVVDGRGGFLCRIDDVKDFANKVDIVRSDESLRRSMGAFNRKRAEEKFSLGLMAKEYIKLYQSL